MLGLPIRHHHFGEVTTKSERYCHMVATIKTSLSLPKTLCNQAETLAQCLKISRNQLFGMAIEHFIRNYQRQTPRDEMKKMDQDQPDLNEPSKSSSLDARPKTHIGEGRMGINQGDIYWVQVEDLSGSEPGIRHPHVVIQENILN
jgi:hypothetical protein